ncbi:hypothetical protein PHLCEN_2v13514 [Hermanssonia centrifuga]|uniref:Holocytochrome c-type synthase n=1 Tax=Hermanssonia centrifuga TaxID=98765 RepID=A0A2R6NE18_9APHY|nr:hypothetical protein PHLCEN_2v13514 [Hermanssonia centrifuga]
MGQTTSTASSPAVPITSSGKCPVPHTTTQASTSSGKCPIEHAPSGSQSSPTPAQCPIGHEGTEVNPRNQMPTLSQSPASNQSAQLPTDRTESSIPRDEASRWEYPSPQQFHNALVRKGWETPEEHVETMVQIHNFLNEQAWLEILKWEKKENPTEPPFDRHDWVVKRKTTGEEVRYVIDYYSAPPEQDGSPVFSLDVRPALDSFGSVKQRIAAATEDAWASVKADQTGRV